MGLLGWGLFGALFGIADEVNTRKGIKQEQAASAKRVAEFKQRTDACKALAFNTCIKLTQTSPRQIHLSWDCQDSDNSVAKEFKVYQTSGIVYKVNITNGCIQHTHSDIRRKLLYTIA